MKKAIAAFLWFVSLQAAPQKGSVAHGTAHFSKEAAQLCIDQMSDKLIINWDSFSIGQGEHVHFRQPSKKATALNRVSGKASSEIHGALTANGKIYLVNPNGIVIGPQGRVKSSGFLASALQIADEHFLSEKGLRFSAAEGAGRVENFGEIEVEGDAALLGKAVRNAGTIRVEGGSVALLAGDELLLRPENEDYVWIAANRDSNVHALAVNHEGYIESVGLERRGGKVYLHAQKEKCDVSGSIDSAGGLVHILGESVEVKKEAIIRTDALESGNGGKVIIWGEERALFSGNVSSKGGNLGGDGGFVEVSSPKELIYAGGQVHTLSPKGHPGTLLLDPSDITIDTNPSSPAFVPPTYNPAVASATLNNVDLQNALAGANVVVSTSNGSGGNGTITVDANVAWSAATTLQLLADRNIMINSGVTISNTSMAVFTAMDFQANNAGNAGDFVGISLDNAVLSAQNGSISLQGRGGDQIENHGIVLDNSSEITTNQGSITLSATSGSGPDSNGFFMTASSAVSTVDGNIDVVGTSANSGGIFILGPADFQATGAGNISFDGSAELEGIGVATANITTSSGNINLQGEGLSNAGSNGISISDSNLVTNGGNIELMGEGFSFGTVFGSSSVQLGADPTKTITISGSGGTGVAMIISTMISSVGNISIEGTSVNDSTSQPHGIFFTDSTISTTGTGNIMVSGTGGSATNSFGLFADAVQVSSIDGNIDIVGVSDLTTTGIIVGLFFQDTGDVNLLQSTNGAISLEGLSSAGIGLIFRGDVSGTNGNISIEGQGEQAGLNIGDGSISNVNGDIFIEGIGNLSVGVAVVGATVESTGNTASAGTITLHGEGGGSYGIFLSEQVNSIEGDIFVTGQTSDPSGTTAGILLQGGSINGTGSANISLEGTGLVSTNPGVHLNQGQITNATGTIEITAVSPNGIGLFMEDPTDSIGAVAASGNITITTDTLTLDGMIESTGDLLMQTINPGTSMGLGNGASGIFNLDQTELDVLQPGFNSVTFGRANATNIVEIGTMSFSQPLIVRGGTVNVLGALNNGAQDITFEIGISGAGVGATAINALVTTTGTFQVNGNAPINNFAVGVGGLTAILNGAGSANTLTGPDLPSSWIINANNQGTLNATALFTGMQSLIGGSANDTFTFTGPFQIANGINGGGGNNLLNGPDINSSWNVTGNNAGAILPGGALGATSFSNMQLLVGGSLNDVFTFQGPFQILGTSPGIDGGGGVNQLVGPNINTTWIITGADSGSIFPVGAPGATLFENIQQILGGSANDIFDLSAGIVFSDQIDGGGGRNTLVGPNVPAVWNLTSDNAGNVAGIFFVNITDLTGGSGNDDFIFSDQVNLSGHVDGGGGFNTLDYTLFTTPVFIFTDLQQASNLGDGYSNIQRIIGNVTFVTVQEVESIQTTFTTTLNQYRYYFTLWRTFEKGYNWFDSWYRTILSFYQYDRWTESKMPVYLNLKRS